RVLLVPYVFHLPDDTLFASSVVGFAIGGIGIAATCAAVYRTRALQRVTRIAALVFVAAAFLWWPYRALVPTVALTPVVLLAASGRGSCCARKRRSSWRCSCAPPRARRSPTCSAS